MIGSPLLAQILSGFSICSALLLASLAHRYTGGNDDPGARWAARLLLFSLAGLQVSHFFYLQRMPHFVHSPIYGALLFAVAPAFYFYSRQLLTLPADYRWADCGHFLPIVIAPFLFYRWTVPMAFLVGSLYVFWLSIRVYRLRAQRQRFRLELGALGLLWVLAVLVIILGFMLPILSEMEFIEIYAILIGLIFLIIIYILLRFPAISLELSEAVQATYGASTLGRVDCATKLQELTTLMYQEKIYCNENLSLSFVAERLNLTPHQLSELLNTRLQKGFSRYVREVRVAEAKRQLLHEPSASVLSIGLAVGFASQSNFYAAFKEIEGLAPGQFRKNHAA
jgi:AraC-like DNA-binding protein